MAYFIFYVFLLILETVWFYFWLGDKMQFDEMGLTGAVRDIIKPYNDKRLRQFNAMKKSIS